MDEKKDKDKEQEIERVTKIFSESGWKVWTAALEENLGICSGTPDNTQKPILDQARTINPSRKRKKIRWKF